MKCCINGENLIRLLYLSAKLFKFEIQKCGQILCAHKPYFLMPGHICAIIQTQIKADTNTTIMLIHKQARQHAHMQS